MLHSFKQESETDPCKYLSRLEFTRYRTNICPPLVHFCSRLKTCTDWWSKTCPDRVVSCKRKVYPHEYSSDKDLSGSCRVNWVLTKIKIHLVLKTMYTSLLQNLHICFISQNVSMKNTELSTMMDIFVDMHDTSQAKSRNFFSRDLYAPSSACTVTVSNFKTNWTRFKQYLIVGSYLTIEYVFNGLLHLDVIKTWLIRLEINSRWRTVCCIFRSKYLTKQSRCTNSVIQGRNVSRNSRCEKLCNSKSKYFTKKAGVKILYNLKSKYLTKQSKYKNSVI